MCPINIENDNKGFWQEGLDIYFLDKNLKFSIIKKLQYPRNSFEVAYKGQNKPTLIEL